MNQLVTNQQPANRLQTFTKNLTYMAKAFFREVQQIDISKAYYIIAISDTVARAYYNTLDDKQIKNYDPLFLTIHSINVAVVIAVSIKSYNLLRL